jgi:hypothetical protein
MYLTEDQRFFLSILRESGCVRADQVLPLLRIKERYKEQYQADAMLRNLRYQGQVIPGEDGILRLPGHRDTRRDGDAILALDAMIALEPKRLLQISGRKEFYPLCYLLQRRDDWVTHFAFIPVPPGQEARISQLIQAEPVEYVFLLYLDSLEQHKGVHLLRSHYFLVRQSGVLHFYKGGEARQ